MRGLRLLALIATLAGAPGSAPAPDGRGQLPLRVAIEAEFESARDRALQIDGHRIAGAAILLRLYQARAFEALWTDADRAERVLAAQ